MKPPNEVKSEVHADFIATDYYLKNPRETDLRRMKPIMKNKYLIPDQQFGCRTKHSKKIKSTESQILYKKLYKKN